MTTLLGLSNGVLLRRLVSPSFTVGSATCWSRTHLRSPVPEQTGKHPVVDVCNLDSHTRQSMLRPLRIAALSKPMPG